MKTQSLLNAFKGLPTDRASWPTCEARVKLLWKRQIRHTYRIYKIRVIQSRSVMKASGIQNKKWRRCCRCRSTLAPWIDWWFINPSSPSCNYIYHQLRRQQIFNFIHESYVDCGNKYVLFQIMSYRCVVYSKNEVKIGPYKTKFLLLCRTCFHLFQVILRFTLLCLKHIEEGI
jgi:hypothetical protein